MFLSVSPAFCDPKDTFFSKIRSAEAEIQLFAKILHNGSESGSVTLANQIHFFVTCTASVSHAYDYVRLIGQRHTSAYASVMQDLRKQLYKRSKFPIWQYFSDTF